MGALPQLLDRRRDGIDTMGPSPVVRQAASPVAGAAEIKRCRARSRLRGGDRGGNGRQGGRAQRDRIADVSPARFRLRRMISKNSAT